MLRNSTTRMLRLAAVGFSLACTAAIARPPEAKLTVEHSFAPHEGRWPSAEATLVKGRGHKVYGVVGAGGAHDNGTAYSFNTRNGHFKVLYAFAPDEFSEVRPTAIVVDSSGDLLVTTYQGGDFQLGTIRRLEDDGSLTLLHTFDGENGGLPGGRLTVVGDSIVGTGLSGPLGHGSVYRYQSSGEFQLLHAFGPPSYEETLPFDVNLGANGNLYGATYGYIRPMAENGALYSLSADGGYQVLHYFTGPDGSRPLFAPIVADNGDLWGTATEGGEFGCGVIYRLQLPATLTVVHSFDREIDGCVPFGGLVKSANGKFYGTTYIGGSSDVGTFFEVSPNGTFRKLIDFDAARGQGLVQSSLLEVEPGSFYGTSTNGGRFGLGHIYRIKLK